MQLSVQLCSRNSLCIVLLSDRSNAPKKRLKPDARRVRCWRSLTIVVIEFCDSQDVDRCTHQNDESYPDASVVQVLKGKSKLLTGVPESSKETN